ncbi:MAG: hypothetical protein ABIJ31_06815 [Pseudomonadota bacterium]
MTYKELLKKYNSKEVFIYGKSVIQIVEMETYVDSDVKKTDFIYHTERNRRGVITIAHDDQVTEKFAV